MVNALSEWAGVEVVRGGKRHSLSFRRGVTEGELVTEDAGADAAGGTVVRFMPDPLVRNENEYGRRACLIFLQCGRGVCEWRVFHSSVPRTFWPVLA